MKIIIKHENGQLTSINTEGPISIYPTDMSSSGLGLVTQLQIKQKNNIDIVLVIKQEDELIIK